MKKLTLFLVAIFAMVNVANAQRAWAYDLELTPSVDSYTFAFKAVTAGDATLVFYKEGVEAGTLNLGSVSAGDNTVTKTSEELLAAIQQSGDFTWGVKMTGEEVGRNTSGLTLEVTDVSRGIYHFYLPQGIVVDNNPESATFSKIFIVEAQGGKLSATQVRSERGIYVYDQTLTNLNTLNKGILPNNITLSDGTRQAMHRIAINPINNHVAFAYNVSGSPAVWSVPANNLDDDAVNLIAGTAITMPNSICFDENGVLYVMDNANATTGGTLYKVVDGTATKIAQNTLWQHKDNSLAYDGRGGIWIAQSVDDNDWPSYEILSHINSKGEIDWKSSNYTSLFSNVNGDGYSRRGQCAYSSKYQLLAFGGNDRATIYQVVYDKTTGVPTLTSKERTIFIGNKSTTDNIDGLAFDYAGDLYLMCATRERFYKYSNPTTTNTCTVPAKKAQVITLVSATPEHTVTISVNGNGTVTGANTGTYLEGTELTLTANPAEHYEFTGWTGDVTSTENPLNITVDGNKNVTANFAKKQYTLTVLTNDENKGAVTGAGTYDYGTVVTIEAIAQPGYKLLYWSDRSSELSRTITMNKNEALSAYFVKEYNVEPTFTIEKVWENAQVPAATGDGYQAVGWDQKIYMQNKTAGKIQVFSNGTDAIVDYATSGTGQQIAVDEAGNLIVFNAYFATSTPNSILIYKKGDATGTAVSFTLQDPARCDFFSASGDIYSPEGGYVYFYCAGKTVINRLKITNGAATTSDVTTDVVGESVYSSPQNTNYVMVDIFGNLVAHARSNAINAINIYTNETKTFSLQNIKMGTLGGCSFELGGKELWAYHAGATNYSSEWNLYNMTDGKFLSDTILYAVDKTNSTNNACNWLNVQVVDEKTAYIYQFCPKKAVALWKVSFKENYIVSASATNGTVKGAGTYQEGATATLTAIPNTGYKFVNWTKGGVEVSTEANYSFPVTENVELVANFEAITSKAPRAWAYDMKLGEEGDNYTFTFKATTAGQATITFKDKDGNALAQPESQNMPAVAGENKFTIAKSDFESGVDAFWSITMDGAPIEGVVEVTDQSRGIYDFYNMMGVVVDNNTDSKDFGKIYVQQSYERSYASSSTSNNGLTTRANDQKSGIFIYNQALDELNSPSNVGYKPTVPSGYTEIGSSSSAFQRLNIDPKTGNLVFSHAVSGKPAVFAINRDDMTGDVTNLLTGVADMTRSVAHCFDVDGTLFVMNFADNKGTIYKVVNGEATKFTETSSRFINANITIASDGRGGFWISQNRGQIDYYYQLAHVTSEGAIDWSIYDDLGTYKASPATLGTSSLGWLGSSSRGALAYDAERNILAQGRNGKVELYTVSYEPTITLTPLHTIASNYLGNNIDGLAFDYAGDLYVVNSSKEKFQKFTLPTADNICTVAAPALEAIRSTPVYTVSVESNNNEWGIVSGGGTFEEGETATITATAATNYKFVNWTKEDAEVSTENPYTFAVIESATYVANFEEITKYTINVTIMDDEKMGTVEGAGTYYEGTEVTLTAKANAGYVFVDWSDGNTDESRTFTAGVDLPETLTANFKVAVPRAWAYDLRLDADTDPANYIFTFNTTSAGTATLNFKYKEGTIFYTHSAVVATGKTTIKIAKSTFDAATKDIYWEVELAGEAIAKMAEITDPTRNIYDFYNSMGVVVDNNTNSEHFGKIYIQQSYNGANDGIADRSDTQTAGIFIYDQELNELNEPNNTGIKPQLPYTIGGNRQVFKRITINPSNGDIAFCNNTTTDGGAYVVSRENLAGEAINLTKHISEIQKVNALCFDDEGNLYVVANVSTSASPNGNIYQIKTDGTHTELTLNGVNLFYDQEIAMASDGHGGLWIAQNRWGTAAGTLFHVNVTENKIDFKVEAGKDYSDWFAGANYRGAIAYDTQRDILAVHSQARASIFQVTYAADGVPSISKICQTPNLGKNELDGLAFDYAGDLYVVNSGTERFYKYVLPTNTNTCTVPAPESQVIKKEARYTVTVTVNDEAMGTATGGGTEFLTGDIATLSATANDGYQFVNWTYGITTSTDNPLELTVEGDITVTAHFEAKPLAIEGTVKRAVQIGESTVVLTHEADGTPHLYKVVDGTLEAEISQEGVIARDIDNAGDYLSISDIAVTEDGKLVACNYILCQNEDGNVDDGYKRGESKFYIWENLTSKPSIWFTSKMTSNWFRSKQGYTMAVKGTSQNAEIFTTGTHGTNGRTRFSWYHIIGGAFEEPAVNNNDYYHFHNGPDNIHATGNSLEALVGTQYELNASPLEADRWIMDGNLVEPYEYVLPATNNEALTEGVALAKELGKKFNGATYLSVGNLCFMVAPYADASGNVAGVKVLDINNGLAAAKVIETLDLVSPVAGTAAATAVKVDGYDLAITLVVDATIYTLETTIQLEVTIGEDVDNTTNLAPYVGKTVKATVTRSFKNDSYKTITLPFSMDADQITDVFGDATVFEFINVIEGPYEINLRFRPTSKIVAGTPYIIALPEGDYEAKEDGFTIEDVVIDTELRPITFGNITMKPVLNGGEKLTKTTEYWLATDNYLYNANDPAVDMPGLRAYFISNSPLPIRARVVYGENEETELPIIQQQPENNVRKIMKDGQIIIIRGEQQYNVQGQRIE